MQSSRFRTDRTLFSELIEKTESSDVFDELEVLLKKRREELGK